MESIRWNDPIVEETRAIRRELFRECDWDLQKLHEMLKKSEERHKNHLVDKSDVALPTANSSSKSTGSSV